MTFVGRSPAHEPIALRVEAVNRSAVWLAGPDTAAVAAHAPPPLADRSSEINPPNESAVAKPLIAPFQSFGALTHPPSTQLAVCTTVTVMARVGKFADSKVPDHIPERSANGPLGTVTDGAGAGVGIADMPPHAPATHAAKTIAKRFRTTV